MTPFAAAALAALTLAPAACKSRRDADQLKSLSAARPEILKDVPKIGKAFLTDTAG
ncbi:MAG: hypothetical protein HY275_17525, partial [Gemmatimonadetes bacterium]|nr:hypothetical protein [Gemmatimonadota bacterium]